MCGIVGFTGKYENNEEIITAMLKRIQHRGPDGHGIYKDDNFTLGHLRLSLIDSIGGHQPLHSADGKYVVAFNGMIYNHAELREKLTALGHAFATQCDTEVLLHMYVEYGADMLNQLRGPFAFVIYNNENGKIFGARDFFGIKPFFYFLDGDNIAFASEIKAFMAHPAFAPKLNTTAFEQYLTFNYSALPETFFCGVFRLLPGHSFTFDGGKMEIARYFTPTFAPKEVPLEDSISAIEKSVAESVKLHMQGEYEIGSFLSSGVDSSYLSATSGVKKTITVGFESEKFNETNYAKELSDQLGIENISRTITAEDYWNALPKAMYHMDEPLGDASAIGFFLASEEAAKHVKIALSGEGADEFFCGYGVYRNPFPLGKMKLLPFPVRRLIRNILLRLPFGFRGANYLIRSGEHLEEKYIGLTSFFTFKERNRILRNPTARVSPAQLVRPLYDQSKGLDDLTRMQNLDVQMWLPGDILVVADRMSMAHSLETRTPLMDMAVFEAGASLPPEHKVKGRTTKAAFRLAAARHLPEEWFNKEKLGFPVPFSRWLQEEKYYSMVREAFMQEGGGMEHFKRKPLLEMLDKHKSGKRDFSKKIWCVYAFLVWHKQYFSEENNRKDA
ncbi:MAG: asparagine synthase (glutamine-hydrolyzing) [Oscillospiraceae bacterium]|nr:asparagine synthase (glutamine-hydrolyzing) [Oscillospiraceae bacterium]